MNDILFLILHGSVDKERVENVKKTWVKNNGETFKELNLI